MTKFYLKEHKTKKIEEINHTRYFSYKYLEYD